MSFAPQTIIVPIDFSTNSEKAIRTALDVAPDPAAIHLVHVLYPLDAISPGVVWGDMNDAKREQAVKKTFKKFLKQHNCEGVRTVVRVGHPGEEIVDYADETGADLIIVPSHGHHGMKRFVLGSVAEKVVRHAKCPVLVLTMAIPGLALFYGGLVRAKNMASVLTQIFVIVSVVAIVWVLWGYSLAFTSGNAFFGGLSLA